MTKLDFLLRNFYRHVIDDKQRQDCFLDWKICCNEWNLSILKYLDLTAISKDGVIFIYFNMDSNFFLNLKKIVYGNHKLLVESNGEHALSKSTWKYWFKRLQSGDFDITDVTWERTRTTIKKVWRWWTRGITRERSMSNTCRTCRNIKCW